MSKATYHLHNTSRSIHTRTKRQQAAQHGRFVQRFEGGVTLRRSRPVTVSEAWVKAHEAELKAKIEAGLVELRTPGGELVNMSTMKAAPAAAPAPLPHPPADSIARDKPGPSLPLRSQMNQPAVNEKLEVPATLLADQQAELSQMEPEPEPEVLETTPEPEPEAEETSPASPKGKEKGMEFSSSKKKGRK